MCSLFRGCSASGCCVIRDDRIAYIAKPKDYSVRARAELAGWWLVPVEDVCPRAPGEVGQVEAQTSSPACRVMGVGVVTEDDGLDEIVAVPVRWWQAG